ncbi:MAG: hypothetical protein ACI4NO_07585, partial [Oxalobacter sp.]
RVRREEKGRAADEAILRHRSSQHCGISLHQLSWNLNNLMKNCCYGLPMTATHSTVGKQASSWH